MLAQLAARPADSGEDTSSAQSTPGMSGATAIDPSPPGLGSVSGGAKLTLDCNGDATAVSDEWMSTDTDGGTTDSSATDGELVNTSMARPCSALSLADLGDLCGDQEVEDGCGDAFLVGGDCDDVNGSGIGLDLYDLGQVRAACALAAGGVRREASEMFCFLPRARCAIGHIMRYDAVWSSRLYQGVCMSWYHTIFY